MSLKSVKTINVVGNRDTGSLPVANADLPQAFRENGMKPAAGTLAVRLKGESNARNITYIMGSESKGWHLCAKGSGKFPTDGEFEILVRDTEGSQEEAA